MSKEDKFFNFVSRLQGWAQTESRRQGVKHLPTAMAATTYLVDYKLSGSTSTWQKWKQDGSKKHKPARKPLDQVKGKNDGSSP